MKYYKSLLLIIMVLVIVPGCDEDKFLKEEPRDSIFADNLFVKYYQDT